VGLRKLWSDGLHNTKSLRTPDLMQLYGPEVAPSIGILLFKNQFYWH